MDIQKIKSLLKQHKYISIDYSEKFKLDIDYDKMETNEIYIKKCSYSNG